jgi:hypothetical protein
VSLKASHRNATWTYRSCVGHIFVREIAIERLTRFNPRPIDCARPDRTLIYYSVTWRRRRRRRCLSAAVADPAILLSMGGPGEISNSSTILSALLEVWVKALKLFVTVSILRLAPVKILARNHESTSWFETATRNAAGLGGSSIGHAGSTTMGHRSLFGARRRSCDLLHGYR